mmetsp:Transcript_5012/g.12226  ORF Transcript_5012/g.12226 Transcript_5012/m.12226 type:complete len:215 (-) Transcript_5012:40-684(-)
MPSAGGSGNGGGTGNSALAAWTGSLALLKSSQVTRAWGLTNSSRGVVPRKKRAKTPLKPSTKCVATQQPKKIAECVRRSTKPPLKQPGSNCPAPTAVAAAVVLQGGCAAGIASAAAAVAMGRARGRLTAEVADAFEAMTLVPLAAEAPRSQASDPLPSERLEASSDPLKAEVLALDAGSPLICGWSFCGSSSLTMPVSTSANSAIPPPPSVEKD